MTRRRNLSIAAALLALMGLVLATITVSAAPPGAERTAAAKRRTLRFGVKFSPQFTLDLGTNGPSKGDEIISHDVIVNRRGERVGHEGLTCTVTNARIPEALCQVVFKLRGRGTITGAFLNQPPPEKTGAITGGTGAFRLARGHFTLVESGRDRAWRRNTLVLYINF